MYRSIVVLIGGLTSLSAALLFAQDAVLGQKYGGGVHAYFTGDYVKSYEQLTAAIKGESKDPRPYYFRGLTYLKLGRPQEAVMDFKKGSELESLDSNRFYNVSRALERVQGTARAELENYRVDARMAALEEADKIRKARYEAIQLEESRVLREQALAAPPEPIETPAPTTEPATEANPFGESEEKPAADAAEKPAGKAEDNPFDEDAEKSTEKKTEKKKTSPPKKEADKAEDNPFGDSPEKPEAKDKSDEEKPDEKKSDEKKPDEKKSDEKSDPDNPFQDEPAAN